jgi:hypothetical protein
MKDFMHHGKIVLNFISGPISPHMYNLVSLLFSQFHLNEIQIQAFQLNSGV